jgi:hypothetical protein
MSNAKHRRSLERIVALGAIAVGLGAGSYGIASAAGGLGSSASSGSNGGVIQAATSAAQPNAQHPWGGERSDETLLTGDAASKVKALALAKLPGATIVRVETDADGNAAYEAHVVKSDGTPATVYVNKQFEVVSVQSGMPSAPASAQSGTSA